MKSYNEEPFVTEMKNKQNWDDRALKEIRKKLKVYLKNICDDKCFYCKTDIRGRDAHIEHVVSKSEFKIFTYKPENLILCCSDCNSLKNNLGVFTEKVNIKLLNSWEDYPLESTAYKIIHPYIDKYEDYLERKGIIYTPICDKYDKGEKGLNTIIAYNLDRLSLAEKNVIANNYPGILFEIRNNTNIGPEEAKKIISDVLNPKPKYAPFDEFINLKLRGSHAYSEELINQINELDSGKFNDCKETIEIFKKTNNIMEIEKTKLENTLSTLKIIREIIRITNDRRDIRVMCSYNIGEIIQYFSKDEFLKSNSGQVLFAIKFLNILETLNVMDFITKDSLIIEEINELIDIIINIGEIGA